MRVLLPALVLVWMQIIASVPLKPRELGWYPTDSGMRLHVAMTLPGRLRTVANDVDEASPFELIEGGSNRNGRAVVALAVAAAPFLVSFFAVGPWRRPPWELLVDALRHQVP